MWTAEAVLYYMYRVVWGSVCMTVVVVASFVLIHLQD